MEPTPVYSISHLKEMGNKLNDHLHTLGLLSLNEYVLPTMSHMWNEWSLTFATNIMKNSKGPPWLIVDEIEKFFDYNWEVTPSIYYSTLHIKRRSRHGISKI